LGSPTKETVYVSVVYTYTGGDSQGGRNYLNWKTI